MTLDGKEMFKLVDSTGLPLEVIVEKAWEKGLGVHLPQFAESAAKAGWSQRRTLQVIREAAANILGAEVADKMIKMLKILVKFPEKKKRRVM